MAQRRMFSLEIVDTDQFLEMPASSQNLYFHLGMRADDDGFVASPKKITAMVGCAIDDLRILISKGLIIPFDSGICVIRDWKSNNYIQKDRYHETRYLEEKGLLSLDSSGAYHMLDTNCIQNVSILDTQVRLGKDRLGKDRQGESEGSDQSGPEGTSGPQEKEEEEEKNDRAGKPPRSRFIPPEIDEVRAYCQEKGRGIDPEQFFDYYTANGWKQGGGKPIVDWKAAVRTWARRQGEDKPSRPKGPPRIEKLDDGTEVAVYDT